MSTVPDGAPALDAVLEWGRGAPGFARAHAEHAAALAGAFVAGLGGDGRALRLAALDLACVLWVDDLFDAPGDAGAAPEGAETLAAPLRGGPPATPAAAALARLDRRFRDAAPRPEDHRWWRATLVDVVRASEADRAASRGGRTLSWDEYLRNAEHSIAVAHTVAALSLAHGLGLAAEAGEPRFRSALRRLCLSMRLRNDLAGVERERREGSRANGVLLLERRLPSDEARDFVEAERRGYERKLAEELSGFPPSHPFPRVARVMAEAVERFYAAPDSRYAGSYEAGSDARRT
ncbi:MAG TPA: terpene synthase family protein [Longimicrobiaceae bacterium]